MRFQWSNEMLKPNIDTVVMAPPEEITPEKVTEANHHVVNVESDSEVEFLYEHASLRHSKRLKVVPDRFKAEEEEEDFNWTPLADTPAEQIDHEDLWKEMEHSLTTLAFLEQKQLIFGWNKGEEVLVLQGDQELPLRAKIMDKFNGDVHGKCKVLLASTTACAEGISLTAASRLVMLDSEWNHSKTRQAIARAFRPGQEKVVYVYLLLASGTWEEGKYKSNARKAWMSKMIFLGRYIEFSSSRQVEHIDDELLRELVEEDEIKMLQLIMRPS
ncbi:hypothetical protein BHE74_00010348 [Ensete ventricosum]|nr:hypothetical protein GW17_00021018 [Ensete ventricosum]RWW81269.1 hypothetical protein BHE74_00010348 [Ensete ventricosum]RZR98058.1 hypothetical protein BHM03_00027356 [Ensete ventricosum]